jgi:hypothetical protein
LPVGREFFGLDRIANHGAERAGAGFALEEKQHAPHVISELASFDLVLAGLSKPSVFRIFRALNAVLLSDARDAGSPCLRVVAALRFWVRACRRSQLREEVGAPFLVR